MVLQCNAPFKALGCGCCNVLLFYGFRVLQLAPQHSFEGFRVCRVLQCNTLFKAFRVCNAILILGFSGVATQHSF